MAKNRTRLEEITRQDLPPVDGNVIRGAKLLGLNSRNNRRYESKALDAAKKLYEDRKVYVNHPKREDAGVDRNWNDWAGVIENVQYRKDDGLYGDIRLRQESSYFKGIVEVANDPKFRKNCGLSHVAEGESHYDGDTEIIESIKEVFSVDLVTDPATTAGLFESVRPKKTSLREAVEALPDCPERKKLVEMLGTYGIGDMPAEEEKPTDPLGEIAAMCRELIRMLGEALVAKNTAPPPAVPAPNADPNSDPNKEADEKPEDEEMTDEQKQAFESLSRENAELKASTMLLESGREVTDIRKKALANCETDEERKELLESWDPIEVAERPARSPGISESDQNFTRGNTKKFAASLR